MARTYTMSPAALQQRKAAAAIRGRELSQDPDHQRAAGLALAAKMHPRYFVLLGEIGGRRRQQRKLENYAAPLAPDWAESWLERAGQYAAAISVLGQSWMTCFWTQDELADEPLLKRPKFHISDDEEDQE